MLAINFFIFFIIVIILLMLICVSLSNNRVFAVLFLIISYLFLAILLFIINVEFIAFVILITYAGAVLVFFLFVVIMLGNVNYRELDIVPSIFGLIFLFVFYFIFLFLLKGYHYNIDNISFIKFSEVKIDKLVLKDSFILDSNIYEFLVKEPLFISDNMLNQIESISMLKVSTLYKNNLGAVVGCALLLFLAIFGSITILLNIKNKEIRRQESIDQILKVLRT